MYFYCYEKINIECIDVKQKIEINIYIWLNRRHDTINFEINNPILYVNIYKSYYDTYFKNDHLFPISLTLILYIRFFYKIFFVIEINF